LNSDYWTTQLPKNNKGRLKKSHPSGHEFLHCSRCCGVEGDMIRIGVDFRSLGGGSFAKDTEGYPILYYKWLCECGHTALYDTYKPESEVE
jgi:hypothetical protein